MTLYSVPKGPACGELSARKELRWERGTSDRTHNMCCVIVPEAFLHDNGAAKLTIFCRGVWTRSWHRRASAMTSFLIPRRQSVGRGLRRDGDMGALGRPARRLPPWYQTNLVFAVSPVVSVRRNVACEMEAVQK